MNYKIIDLKPIVTEKALSAQQTQDKYAFWVSPSATKTQIEVAFKSVFNITPLSINTVTLKGKTKTNWQTRAYIKKSDRKKAIISVPKGTKIELLKLNTK
ncbi:MAG TPA: 50S ribosomal protein L23 [Candidatus Woesebacteria bacterium]|jgi:large subunit ribosomal protein L23|nr:50S ribosomal protein L23 [Candidatus Shapirobacteria bacterium]HOR01858.1 50S ribosomal protein L23 [Candidatus Woesebacteria bacterium]